MRSLPVVAVTLSAFGCSDPVHERESFARSVHSMTLGSDATELVVEQTCTDDLLPGWSRTIGLGVHIDKGASHLRGLGFTKISCGGGPTFAIDCVSQLNVDGEWSTEAGVRFVRSRCSSE